MSITPTWAITQPKRSGRWFAHAAKNQDRKGRWSIIKHLCNKQNQNRTKQHLNAFRTLVVFFPRAQKETIRNHLPNSPQAFPPPSNISEGWVLSSVVEIYSSKWISMEEHYMKTSRAFCKTCVPSSHPQLLSQVMQEVNELVQDLKTSLWYRDTIRNTCLLFVPSS